MIKGTLEPGEFERMITEIESLPKLPAAIEAFWDGDSIGWMVHVSAIIDESSPGLPRYTDHFLATLQGVGGDFRVFKNQVPPWPEAELAKEFGGALAAHFSIPFFFPSPDHPENECPRWGEREQGIPCGRCGILLHQDDSCPWRGVWPSLRRITLYKYLDIGENWRLNPAVLAAFFAFVDEVSEFNVASRFV